jgi:hypothetical protein
MKPYNRATTILSAFMTWWDGDQSPTSARSPIVASQAYEDFIRLQPSSHDILDCVTTAVDQAVARALEQAEFEMQKDSNGDNPIEAQDEI